jgi:hypothetical protein
MTEPPRRLVEVCTFEAVDGMIIDNFAALIASAEERAKAAAQIAAEAQPKPPAKPSTVRTLVGLIGPRMSGFF